MDFAVDGAKSSTACTLCLMSRVAGEASFLLHETVLVAFKLQENHLQDARNVLVGVENYLRNKSTR